MKIDRLLIQQSLGSHIFSFQPIAKDETIGYSIELVDGDICSEENQLHFSSTIDYLCDPSVKSGRPQLVEYHGDLTRRSTAQDCHFRFQFRSMHACPVCRRDQVEVIKHQECQAGQRAVSKMPKEYELCVVPEQLETKPDETTIQKFISPLANKKDATYNHIFNLPGELRTCSDYEDALGNSLLMGIFKFFIILTCCLLVCFCGCWCALSQLSRRYENLEKKRIAHLNWLERMRSDQERGVTGPRTSFSQKLVQMQ